MADLNELQQQVAEARTALHNKMTGKQVTDVTRDGRRIQFSNMSTGDITGYIRALDDEIAGCSQHRACRAGVPCR